MKVIFYGAIISLLVFTHSYCVNNKNKEKKIHSAITDKDFDSNLKIVEQILNKVFEANNKSLKCQQRQDIIKKVLTEMCTDSFIIQVQARYVIERQPNKGSVISCGALLHDSLSKKTPYYNSMQVLTFDKIIKIGTGLSFDKNIEVKCEVLEIPTLEKYNFPFKNILKIANKNIIDWPDDVFIEYYFYLPFSG